MPLLWLSIAFLVGILIAANLSLSTFAWLVLAGLLGSLPFLLRILRSRILFPRLGSFQNSPFATRLSPYFSQVFEHILLLPFSLIPCTLALGAARYQASLPQIDPSQVAFYNDTGRAVEVRGVVVEPADARDTYTQLKVRARAIRLSEAAEEQPAGGLLLARVDGHSDWHYGDELRLQGRLETPEEAEDFSYRDYLARQGVYSILDNARVELVRMGQGNPFRAAIYRFKERTLETVYQLWPDPEASLLAGILLGVETGIPDDVEKAFQDTGTSHIIAISGFNITLVSGLFVILLSRLLGRWKGALAALLGIAFYTVLVGAGAGVVRAALMGGLGVFGRQLGRRQEGLNSLTLVAFVMAVFSPLVLWDVSFQLSFTATLGLVLYAQPLAAWFESLITRPLSPNPLPPGHLSLVAAQRISRFVSEYFLFTLAAQVTTLPVIAFHFGWISLVSMLANPAILPVQPAVMVLGGAAVLLGMIFFPLGQLAGALAWPSTAYTIRAVELFAAIPGGAYTLGAIGIIGVAGYYVVLFGWTFAAAHFRKAAAAIGPGLGLAVLGVAAVFAWRSALEAPDGRLHLTLLDTSTVGISGEALLVETPTGRYLLVGGGPGGRALSDGVGRRLPFFQRRLDFLVVGSPKKDEVGALQQAIERFPPDQVLWAGRPDASEEAVALRAALLESGVNLTPAAPGQVLELGEGACLRVVTSRELGGVFLLEWGSFRALLPLGMSFEDLEALHGGRDIGPVTALLLADHGYAPANPPEWIANLQPQVILLSVAAGDWDGLPSPETLEVVEGYTLLRTDVNGWIHLSTDGERMWVEVERR